LLRDEFLAVRPEPRQEHLLLAWRQDRAQTEIPVVESGGHVRPDIGERGHGCPDGLEQVLPAFGLDEVGPGARIDRGADDVAVGEMRIHHDVVTAVVEITHGGETVGFVRLESQDDHLGVVFGHGPSPQELLGVGEVGRGRRAECVVVTEPGRDAGMDDFVRVDDGHA